MKNRIVAALAALAWGLAAQAAAYQMDTLQWTGSTDLRINMVMLGDGYRADQLAKFNSDAKIVQAKFFSLTPLAQYKPYFNVFDIRTPSVEAGSGTGPSATKNTIFRTYYNCNNTQRLICYNGSDSVSAILQRQLPSADIMVIVVNDTTYGGSGGSVAVISTNQWSADIAIHEVAHSFGRVWDEYWNYMPGEYDNMSSQASDSLVPWHHWMGLSGVGRYPFSEVYDDSRAVNYFRPHQGCRMRNLTYPFCAVCTQSLVTKIHLAAAMKDAQFPDSTNILFSGSQLFFVKSVRPIPNTLRVSWTLDGALIGTGDSLTLQASALPDLNSHTLIAMMDDTTAMLRDPTRKTLVESWVVWSPQKTIPVTSLQAQRGMGFKQTQYMLYDMQGRLVMTLDLEMATDAAFPAIPHGKLVPGRYNVRPTDGSAGFAIGVK